MCLSVVVSIRCSFYRKYFIFFNRSFSNWTLKMQTRSMTKRMAQSFEEVKQVTTTWTEAGLRFRNAVLWNIHHYRRLQFTGVDISLDELNANFGLPLMDAINPTPPEMITAMIFLLLTKGYTVVEWITREGCYQDMPFSVDWINGPSVTNPDAHIVHLPFTDELEPLITYPEVIDLESEDES